jgi:hypothetical protein
VVIEVVVSEGLVEVSEVDVTEVVDDVEVAVVVDVYVVLDFEVVV